MHIRHGTRVSQRVDVDDVVAEWEKSEACKVAHIYVHKLSTLDWVR